MYTICVCVCENNDVISFCFYNFCYFFLSYVLLYPYLIPDFKENASDFSPLNIISIGGLNRYSV